MSKSKKSKNYDLKSKAVENLTDSGEQTPEYSEEELNKYRSKGKFKIPELAKVLFAKAWFAGAVCYFIFWGLGMYLVSIIDLLFVLGVAQGMVTDLLLNNVIRFIEKQPGANDKWLMVTRKGSLGLVLNVLYGLVQIICVYMLYNVINLAIISVTGAVDTVPLGVEPILFGVFTMGIDLLFIGMKRMLSGMVSDAKTKARGL
ncbi:MAG: hypothetical protein IKC09_09785 [Oscillospiraceae bacterium]|nr:hypothetical protein [Oscillospiraceae bacterium]